MAVGTWLLYKEIGVGAFFGMAFLISFVPLQSKYNLTFHHEINKHVITTFARTNELVFLDLFKGLCSL